MLSMARPAGPLKEALMASPSLEPGLPSPAKVVTHPLPTTAVQANWYWASHL